MPRHGSHLDVNECLFLNADQISPVINRDTASDHPTLPQLINQANRGARLVSATRQEFEKILEAFSSQASGEPRTSIHDFDSSRSLASAGSRKTGNMPRNQPRTRRRRRAICIKKKRAQDIGAKHPGRLARAKLSAQIKVSSLRHVSR